TQRYQERVEQWDQNREDKWGIAVHPSKANANGATEPDTERANKNRGDRDGNEQGHKGHKDHVYSRRNNLLESLVDSCCNQRHDQRNEDVAAVVRQSNINSKQFNRTGFRSQSRINNALRGRIFFETQEFWRKQS